MSEEVASLFLFYFLKKYASTRQFTNKIHFSASIFLCIKITKPQNWLGGIIFSCKIRQDWLVAFSDSPI
jgi:hypothetical protein